MSFNNIFDLTARVYFLHFNEFYVYGTPTPCRLSLYGRCCCLLCFVVFMRTSSAAAVLLHLLLELLRLPPPYDEWCVVLLLYEQLRKTGVCVLLDVRRSLPSTMINIPTPWQYVMSQLRPLFAFFMLDRYGHACTRRRASAHGGEAPLCSLI